MANDYPLSPTGTIGLQKAFAIAIRQTFRNRLREIFSYLKENDTRVQESLRLTSALDKKSSTVITNLIENIKLDLSPIVRAFIGASWWRANAKVAQETKLGDWVPFDGRVLKSIQDSSYDFLFRFVDGRQKELQDLLATSISQGDTVSQIANVIKDSFRLTAWKSELIARSETVRTYAKSTKMAIVNGGVTKEYQWKTSLRENVCHICKPLHNEIYPIDSPSSPMPITDTHPQCNCGIIPFVRF